MTDKERADKVRKLRAQGLRVTIHNGDAGHQDLEEGEVINDFWAWRYHVYDEEGKQVRLEDA